jgi:hypothetical protein
MKCQRSSQLGEPINTDPGSAFSYYRIQRRLGYTPWQSMVATLYHFKQCDAKYAQRWARLDKRGKEQFTRRGDKRWFPDNR